MAIQNRRGTFTYYDPTKLLPGEFAVVQSGDPSTTSGKALYMAFSAGNVLRIISYEELQAALNAFTFDWSDITNKPTPDTTLTESGNAADAAAVGSAINNAVLNLAPAYSSSSTYAVGAYCVYNKTLYQCNTAINSGEAWNSAHWTQVRVMAATSSLINSAVSTIDGQIDDIEGDISDINTALATKATKTELNAAVSGLSGDIQAEATARQSADSAINTELATKATTTALNAEVTARQNADTALNSSVSAIQSWQPGISGRLEDIDGYAPMRMELGTISFVSTGATFSDSTTRIRTPQDGGIHVSAGDVIGLTDYTVGKYVLGILKDSDGKYASWSTWKTDDFAVTYDGILYMVVCKSDGSEITDVPALASLVRVRAKSGRLDQMESEIDGLNVTFTDPNNDGNIVITKGGT